ncbi:uncharacterized protein LOC105204680 isoform X1 [Solenopsis invicta]|nr:uncharacterized protein LOC105204680 isoform X1 [Solenopsis invicta]
MRCLFAIILAATILLVAAEGKAVPTEGEQSGTQPQLSDYIRDAQTAISSLGTQIQEHLNLPNQEELANTFKEQSTNFANNVQAYLQNITDEVKAKSPELEDFWTNMKTKLSEAVDNLHINPETTEQVNQLRAKFQEGVQTLVTESENAAKTISENSGKVQESIAKITKQAIDIAVKASQNLNQQLQQATTPQP